MTVRSRALSWASLGWRHGATPRVGGRHCEPDPWVGCPPRPDEGLLWMEFWFFWEGKGSEHVPNAALELAGSLSTVMRPDTQRGLLRAHAAVDERRPVLCTP